MSIKTQEESQNNDEDVSYALLNTEEMNKSSDWYEKTKVFWQKSSADDCGMHIILFYFYYFIYSILYYYLLNVLVYFFFFLFPYEYSCDLLQFI